jgi:hypothetical protein
MMLFWWKRERVKGAKIDYDWFFWDHSNFVLKN